MKIAVLGAGGIGGYLGGRLQETGHDVQFLARGAHLEALKTNGLRIESPLGNCNLAKVSATDRISEIRPVDIVLATVKLPDLGELAPHVPQIIREKSRIVTLQNGIDAKSILSAHVDPSIIAQGVIYLAAYISEPGVIMTPGGKHQLLVDQLGKDETMAAFFDAIDASIAIDVSPVSDGDMTVWEKFAAQSSISAVTSLTRMSLGGVFASPEATELLKQLIDEAVAVASSMGIRLDPEYPERMIGLYANQPSAQSSSLIVDILAGKPSELAFLSGRIHTLGQEHGVPTPAHSVAWKALAAYANERPEFAL